MKQRLAAPATLVSLNGISEMIGVCVNDAGEVCVGGGTPHATVAREAAAHYFRAGGPGWSISATRQCATAGPSAGRWPNNDPSGLLPGGRPWLGRHDQDQHARTSRRMTISRACSRPALDEGEIITEVRFPVPERANYQKIRPAASRFALVGVFVAKYADGVRVAVTGASSTGSSAGPRAEAATVVGLLERGGRGAFGACGRHDQRPARIGRLPSAPREGHDPTRRRRGKLNRATPNRRSAGETRRFFGSEPTGSRVFRNHARRTTPSCAPPRG